MSDATTWWLSALTLANFAAWVGIWGANAWRSTIEEALEEQKRFNAQQCSAALTVGVKNAENIVALAKMQGDLVQTLSGKKTESTEPKGKG